MNASKAGKGDERNRNVFNSRQPVIHIAFVKGFVYHDFSYLPSSDHCVKVGSDLIREIIKPSNVIGRLKMFRLYSIYHPVRCHNRDSSLIPYFQSSVIRIISLRASTDEV